MTKESIDVFESSGETSIPLMPSKEKEGLFIFSRDELKNFKKDQYQQYSSFVSLNLNLDPPFNVVNNNSVETIENNVLYILNPSLLSKSDNEESLPNLSVIFSLDFLTNILFNKKNADAYQLLSRSEFRQFKLDEAEIQNLSSLISYIKATQSKPYHPFQEEMVKHSFNLLILEVAAIAKKDPASISIGMTRKEDILVSFLNLLSLHFKEERSVQFYAQALYLTPKHLTRTLKELTNKTCGDFIDEMVISEAKALLSNRSLSIGQVSDALHFSDQFFFSKFFKKRTGLSPREFKQSLS